ncbi:S1 family peptidase [Methylocapsa acidiphila]|uniref:S1 family peptidase n=1 Tax=Methylocapsa acidiphila TaxID=133552 RepID=UPI0018DC935D|nr:trypsin-like serine protease [Methylocapsa acidiphila]
MKAHFQWTERLCAAPLGLVGLLLWLLPTSAAALVGPARESTDLAPYVVVVLNRNGTSASFCTGSVIAQDVVLTAAHCVSTPDDTRIYLAGADSRPIMLEVASVAINPGYRPDAIKRRLVSIDLALLRLAEPLPTSFAPVELSKSAKAAVGQSFRIAGFGVASENAGGTGGVLRQGVLVASEPRSAILLWLTDPNRAGLGGCTGDSGAPVFTKDAPLLVAVAVWAKGDRGHLCGALTQAALVAPQMDWVQNVLRAWSALGRPAP